MPSQLSAMEEATRKSQRKKKYTSRGSDSSVNRWQGRRSTAEPKVKLPDTNGPLRGTTLVITEEYPNDICQSMLAYRGASSVDNVLVEKCYGLDPHRSPCLLPGMACSLCHVLTSPASQCTIVPTTRLFCTCMTLAVPSSPPDITRGDWAGSGWLPDEKNRGAHSDIGQRLCVALRHEAKVVFAWE